LLCIILFHPAVVFVYLGMSKLLSVKNEATLIFLGGKAEYHHPAETNSIKVTELRLPKMVFSNTFVLRKPTCSCSSIRYKICNFRVFFVSINKWTYNNLLFARLLWSYCASSQAVFLQIDLKAISSFWILPP
jgi:hypothetical protein